MFDTLRDMGESTITAEQVRKFRGLLNDGALPADPAEQVELLSALEQLKSAACAVQAESAVALDDVRRSEHEAQGVSTQRQGRGVASEIALARKESPHRGQVLLGFAKIAYTEMPHTLRLLKHGHLNEWRAMLLVRETSCLTAEQRALVDEQLCADPATLAGLGTRALVNRVTQLAVELDPAAAARRARQAETDRRVSLRPAPDTMSYLTGLMPVAQGVAAYAALSRDADTMRTQGDPRSRGQLMADLLIARITGTELPEGNTPPATPVTINITMPDTSLFAGGHSPGRIAADGVWPALVPAETARHLISRSLSQQQNVWMRHLGCDSAGRLVAMSSKQRFFTTGLADYLSQRDQGICRTPYCDAPIRHRDHIQPIGQGGTTTADNGQGLCQHCNHAKQAPRWRQQVINTPGTRHTVRITTPSGHHYVSRAPTLTGLGQHNRS